MSFGLVLGKCAVLKRLTRFIRADLIHYQPVPDTGTEKVIIMTWAARAKALQRRTAQGAKIKNRNKSNKKPTPWPKKFSAEVCAKTHGAQEIASTKNPDTQRTARRKLTGRSGRLHGAVCTPKSPYPLRFLLKARLSKDKLPPGFPQKSWHKSTGTNGRYEGTGTAHHLPALPVSNYKHENHVQIVANDRSVGCYRVNLD